MTKKVRITYHGMDRSPALDTAIHDRAEKLFQVFDRISDCRVVVESPHRRHTKGNPFTVHLEVHVPGDTIVVSRDHHQDDGAHEDPYATVRDAFQVALRQLRQYVERLHATS